VVSRRIRLLILTNQETIKDGANLELHSTSLFFPDQECSVRISQTGQAHHSHLKEGSLVLPSADQNQLIEIDANADIEKISETNHQVS